MTLKAPNIREIVSLRDALKKAAFAEPPESAEMLKLLKIISEIHGIDAEILTKSKLGKVINIVRKRPGVSYEAQALGKKIAREYKAIMDKSGPARVSSNASVVSDVSTSTTATKSSVSSADSGVSSGVSVQHARVVMDVPKVGNPGRDTLRRVLCQALCTDGAHDAAPEVAAAIELGCHEQLGAGAKSKIKSIISNLKNNSKLRENALNKTIPGEEFALMSSENLASDKIKAMNKKANEDLLNSKALAEKEGAHTTEYPCPKCKARDCIYTQLQTRSADEPMTTFCCCRQCGKRWKFC